jgi:acetyl esterase/lipase
MLPLPAVVPPSVLPLPFGITVTRNVAEPSISAYLPDPAVAAGTAVVICPGGVFHFLSAELEGDLVARWLSARGIAAFVLKYRVLPTPAADEDFAAQLQERFCDLSSLPGLMRQIEPLAVADGIQALSVVRGKAALFAIDPSRIGILGFSTGGVVAAGTSMHDDAKNRPDFAAAIYPAPLGRAITVPSGAPPLFLLAAGNDQLAAMTMWPLYSAWQAAGHSVELHLYAEGGHGFALQPQGLPSDHWIDRLVEWLQSQQFLL